MNHWGWNLDMFGCSLGVHSRYQSSRLPWFIVLLTACMWADKGILAPRITMFRVPCVCVYIYIHSSGFFRMQGLKIAQKKQRQKYVSKGSETLRCLHRPPPPTKKKKRMFMFTHPRMPQNCHSSGLQWMKSGSLIVWNVWFANNLQCLEEAILKQAAIFGPWDLPESRCNKLHADSWGK